MALDLTPCIVAETLPRLQHVSSRHGVVIQPVPALLANEFILFWVPMHHCYFFTLEIFLPLEQFLLILIQSGQDELEFIGQDLGRGRHPAVAVAHQHQEVGPRCNSLTAFNLAQADVHCPLVDRGFLANAPAQVDGLKAVSIFLCQFPQPWEDPFLQRVALRFQVAECRTDKYSECT